MPEPARRATPAALERQIESERIGTLYALAPTTLVGGIVYALLMVAMLEPHFGAGVIGGWAAFKVVVAIVRLADGSIEAKVPAGAGWSSPSIRSTASPSRIA